MPEREGAVINRMRASRREDTVAASKGRLARAVTERRVGRCSSSLQREGEGKERSEGMGQMAGVMPRTASVGVMCSWALSFRLKSKLQI